MKVDSKKLIVYIPDTRGVTVSRFGHGNLKIGPNVFTYSRLPGSPQNAALGYDSELTEEGAFNLRGTCPGASDECQAICYAQRPVAEGGPVLRMWETNSVYPEAPEAFPDRCDLVRLHVSGDFNTVRYIDSWTRLCEANPEVTVWGYTRSWRVPELLPALERLRALPNVQLFASLDKSIAEMPPSGWRRAYIEDDPRIGSDTDGGWRVLTCPEETGKALNCESCGYCFRGGNPVTFGDVVFLKH